MNEDDLLEAVRTDMQMMEAHRLAIARLAEIRREALLELRRRRMPVAEIAERLGISRQQVHRLLQVRSERE